MTYPDVWRQLLRVSIGIDQLVGTEEAERVGVVLEVVDDGEGAVDVVPVVGLGGVVAGDALAVKRRVDVDDHVDAGHVEDACAFILEKSLAFNLEEILVKE